MDAASTTKAPPQQQCEVHPGVPTWRSDGLGPMAKKTHIGCWRCHLHRAKDGPPEKQGSARGELALTLARIKDKPAREGAVAEVLTLLMKELRQAQGERELLKKRVEGLTLENRDIGGKWQAEVARCKELETQVEKLEAEMDKTMGVMDELEREKAEAGAKASMMEAQIKQVEKERDGLKADVADLAARVKEVESQLRAVLEQKRLFPMARTSEAASPPTSTGSANNKSSTGAITSSSACSVIAATPTLLAPAPEATDKNKAPTSLIAQPSQPQATVATAITIAQEPTTTAAPSPVLKPTATAATDEQGDSYVQPSASFAPGSDQPPQEKKLEEEQPEPPPQPQQRKHRASVQFPSMFKGLTFGGKGEGQDKEAGEGTGATAAGAGAGGKPKITLTVHMAGQHRVNITIYRTDRFEKMMDKYLAVKKIKAPRDEVHFVVDRVHHTLAPELMPDDLALEDGATINVIVPSEPLEAVGGEAEEAAAQAAV